MLRCESNAPVFHEFHGCFCLGISWYLGFRRFLCGDGCSGRLRGRVVVNGFLLFEKFALGNVYCVPISEMPLLLRRLDTKMTLLEPNIWRRALEREEYSPAAGSNHTGTGTGTVGQNDPQTCVGEHTPSLLCMCGDQSPPPTSSEPNGPTSDYTGHAMILDNARL
jgi:hypothetical protein